MNKKLFGYWIIAVIIILAGTGIYFGLNQQLSSPSPSSNITNFEECAHAGYPVGESYPPQCWTPDGKHFVEKIKQGPQLTPGPIIISGEIVSLAKKGVPGRLETLEATMGLKGSDGRHYALRIPYKLDPEYKFSSTWLHVEVSGTFNLEEIRGPDGNAYDAVGVIDVTSIKEVEGGHGSNTGTIQPEDG